MKLTPINLALDFVHFLQNFIHPVISATFGFTLNFCGPQQLEKAVECISMDPNLSLPQQTGKYVPGDIF